jgi:hypothetical protein
MIYRRFILVGASASAGSRDLLIPSRPTRIQQEEGIMANKDQRSNKEKKKPKAEKDKPKQMSAYKAAMSGAAPSFNPLNKKPT